MISPKKYFKTVFTRPPIFFSFSPDPLWKIPLFLFCCRNHALQRRPNFSARPSMVFWRCPQRKWILSNLYGGWVIFYARRTFFLWYFFKFKASRKLSISAHFRLKQHFSWLECPSIHGTKYCNMQLGPARTLFRLEFLWQIFLVNSKNLVLACSERTIEYRGQTMNTGYTDTG